MAIIEVATEEAVSVSVGSWLARWVPAGASLFGVLFGRGKREPTINNTIGPLAKWFQAPALVMNDMFGAIAKFANTVTPELGKLRARMDRQYAIVTRYAATLYDWATTRAHAELENLAASTNILIRGAKAYSAQLVRAERAVAHAEVVKAGQSATLLFNQARSYAAQLATANRQVAHAETLNLARSTNLEIASTKVYADTVSTQAAARSSAKLSSEVGTAVHPSYSGALADLAAAAATFGAGQPGITQLIGRVPSVAPTTAPAAAAAEGAITRVLTKTLEDCVAPLCKNTSKFGKDLQDLFGLVEGVAFLAFIAAMIEAPETTAADTATVADPVLTATVGAFESLIGL